MAAPATSELTVNGMTCNNCARRVTDALQAVPGVHSVTVNIEHRRATVRWTTDSTNPPALISALATAGYPAQTVSPDKSTTPLVRKAKWHANLWLGGMVTGTLMLGEWGFDLGMVSWFQWTAFGLAGVVQIFAGAQFYRGAWQQLRVGRSNMDTLVALGSSTAFAYSTWALFTSQGSHVYFMEAAAIITLISIGHWIEARVNVKASEALQSLLQLAPATARRLQTSSNPTATAKFNPLDIRNFKPQTASKTVESEVSIDQLQIGDLVVLKPGDRVPVDGLVTEGASAVDESMLTGESMPLEKTAGTELYAGTVNLNGRLVMRVTATGEATALANIIAAVQRAQTSRANIQRLGDRVSSVFVPIVVGIAMASGLWWGLSPASAHATHGWMATFLWPAHPPTGAAAAFIIAASVLIIACPCAMGLATPAAIMAGANTAAKRGILIRDGIALEKAGQVTTVVFDKTGTLTIGKPELVAIAVRTKDSAGTGWFTVDASSADTLKTECQQLPLAFRMPLALAYALSANSKHPLSRSLAPLAATSLPSPALTQWREIRGSGVEAEVVSEAGTRQSARLGSLRWLLESGVEASTKTGFVQDWAEQGATIVGFSIGDDLLALFAIRDPLKHGAAAVIRQLQQQGLGVHLLTGDNATTAVQVARQVGIARENITAEVRPEQKADFVKRLQAKGERVAFVGDGINDAPALSQANLGVAVGRASDVAREAADMILLKSEIEAVPEALGLAQATLRTIHQNLFWAFFYNAVGIPLAASGFMSPVMCAAAMGLSDLLVIGNALRLKRWNPKKAATSR